MAMAMLTWLIAIPLLGFVTGMRAMTAMAVLCWFAYRGDLSLDGTWAFWAAKLVTAIIFTVLALGELVVDKLPKTPNRTAPGPLLARVIFGGLVGAIVAAGLKWFRVRGCHPRHRRRFDRCLRRLPDSPRDRIETGLQGLASSSCRRFERHHLRDLRDGSRDRITASPVTKPRAERQCQSQST